MVHRKELVHQIFQASRKMTAHLNEQMAAVQLTHMQLAIIDFLKAKGEASTLVDIAKYLHVDKSTVTRAVKPLLENRYIVHASSTDHRERRILINKESTNDQSAIDQLKNQFEQTAFKHLSDEQLTTTFETLLQIVTNLNGDEQ